MGVDNSRLNILFFLTVHISRVIFFPSISQGNMGAMPDTDRRSLVILRVIYNAIAQQLLWHDFRRQRVYPSSVCYFKKNEFHNALRQLSSHAFPQTHFIAVQDGSG